MPLDLLLLVVLSAAIHVGWNAVARSLGGTAGFPWLTAVVGVVVLAPCFVWQRLHDPGTLDGRVFALAALSGVLEVAYFLLLQAAYGHAELSLVYPLSRGVAPLLALVPARLLVGDTLVAREFAAIALVLGGALLIARSHAPAVAPDGTRAPARAHGVVLALLVAAAIAAYQTVDGFALRGDHAPRPLEFVFLMQVVLAALLTLILAARGGFTVARRTALFAPLRARPGRVLAAGLAIQLAYVLILVALRRGKIPLVIAARNGGIPISLLVGRYLLHERVSRRRIAASALIVGGVLLLIDWSA